MARRKNEILIEWTEGSCQGEINRVNVKHILLDAQDISVGAFVTARLNSRKYRGLVKDLLEWSAPQKAKRKRKAGGSAKRITEDIAGKTSDGSKENSGTKKKKAGASAGKAGMKAKKAGASFKKKEAGKREDKVSARILERSIESLRIIRIVPTFA